jgi:MarR family transcriptional regulator, organic hydroperoxide resistance regulator
MSIVGKDNDDKERRLPLSRVEDINYSLSVASLEERDTQTAAGEAWRLMFAVFVGRKPHFAALAAELQLSPSQAHALALIEPEHPRSMNELAGLLACHPSNVTGIVDGLESRGLIERRPAPHDRRLKLLALTEEGAEVRRAALARVFEPPPELAALPPEDQRTLRDILARAFGA